MEKPARRKRRSIMAATGVIAGGGALLRARLSPVRVEGPSMEPTLPDGALVAVSVGSTEPKRGSVVVVRRPDGTEHLKRVVAVSGDRFVHADGVASTIEAHMYAVAGDNPDASTDSRHYGPVGRHEIVGVARLCYWPPPAWKWLG
jgi:signal peptidase I